MRLAGELDVSRASCVIGALGTDSGVTVTQSRSPLPPPTPPLMSAVCPARAAPGTAPRGSRHPGPPPGLACRRAVSGQQGQVVGGVAQGESTLHAPRRSGSTPLFTPPFIPPSISPPVLAFASVRVTTQQLSHVTPGCTCAPWSKMA